MRTFATILVVFALLIPVVSIAQQGQPQTQIPPTGQQQCQAQMPNKVELTAEQIQQMKAFELTEQKTMIQLRANLQTAKLEMRELMQADNIDKAKVLKKNDEISSIKAQIAKTRLEGQFNRMSVFTDEQRANMPKGGMMFGGPGCPGGGPDQPGCGGNGPRMNDRQGKMGGHGGFNGDCPRMDGGFGQPDQDDFDE